MPILDRRIPTDWEHQDRYPLRAVMPTSVATVERALRLPPFRARMDQGNEGACVGWSWSWAMSILNQRFYDARWLYHQAQSVDEWPGESYDGTSVRAGGDVLRDLGHCRLLKGVTSVPDLADGIAANRWVTSIDDIRTAIATGLPVVLGINWHRSFFAPIRDSPKDDWWIGRGDLGRVAGGHAIAAYGASDKRQAIKLVNTWGLNYPVVWLPYTTLQRLLDEDGEGAVPTDR